MATIKTAIALYDGVTSPLQSMNRAMNIVLNSFDAMQRTSGKAVDVASIQQAREELAKTATAFDAIEAQINSADQRQKNFNNDIRGGSSAADGLLSKVKQIAMAVGGIAGIKKALNISDQLSSTKARLNVLVDDGGSLQGLEQKIMASAQRSRSAYFGVADAVAKLGSNAGEAFGNNMDQVIAFSELVNKQFVLGGATAQEQSAAMLQLTQAMGSGVLRGDELNSIFEQAPGLIQTIADYIGVSVGEIRGLASEGQITSDIIKNAMFAAADDINAKFDQMPMTWGQIWTSMQNKALSMFSPILEKLNELANSEQFAMVADGIINGLAGIANIATVVLDQMVGIASAVVDNWSWIGPIVYGVAAALLFYTAVTKGAAIAQTAINALKMIAVPLYAALSGATMAETASQWGLNSAMYSCPLVWIILSIIALIAIIYAVVAAINHFAGTSVSATGIICGAFMVGAAFIGNLFVALINFAIDIFVVLWNFIATFANFFGNVFTDPVGAIARLFFDLADTVLSILESLASAIDTIFGSNLAGAVSGWRGSLGSWVDSTFGKGEEIMAKVNAQDYHLDRFEYKSAFSNGYAFGEGIEEKVSGLFDFDSIDPYGAGDDPYGSGTGAYDVANTWDNIAGNTGDTAGNTAAMADALDIAAEDLAYLRDIAEREAINRFTTAEIHMEQHNQNHISSDTDLDGIMDAWAKDFAEKLEVSGEGVYA